LDSKKFLKRNIVFLIVLLFVAFGFVLIGWQHSEQNESWQKRLNEELTGLYQKYPSQIGLYVKNLENGQEFSLAADQKWYLASGIKLPVAITVLRQMEEGKFTLDTELELKEADYIDGAGLTNWKKPGSRLSIKFLMKQMLMYSDNTAADMLIKQVGLERVNNFLKDNYEGEFSEVTTLAGVRRLLYGAIDSRAERLTGKEYIYLKKRPEHRRVGALARLLKVQKSQFNIRTLAEAYKAYYRKEKNSGSLTAYGQLLEDVVRGDFLSQKSKSFLLSTMSKAKTGRRRIKAALPKGVVWAHKTGTQYQRYCDFGIADALIIAACTRRLPKKEAEMALRLAGKAIVDSGAFSERL